MCLILIYLFKVTLGRCCTFAASICPFLWYRLPSCKFIPVNLYGTSLFVHSAFAFLMSNILIPHPQIRLKSIHLGTLWFGHLSLNVVLPQPSPPYSGYYPMRGLTLHSSWDYWQTGLKSNSGLYLEIPHLLCPFSLFLDTIFPSQINTLPLPQDFLNFKSTFLSYSSFLPGAWFCVFPLVRKNLWTL